jgi:hypothetical protein
VQETCSDNILLVAYIRAGKIPPIVFRFYGTIITGKSLPRNTLQQILYIYIKAPMIQRGFRKAMKKPASIDTIAI